tara:strand:- start:257 stop:412 length:156 start_codon:yes stop_codon:yes gene_type:complete
LNKNKNLDQLIAKLIKKYPQIKSGRKNYNITAKKVKKNIKLVEKHFKKINN